MREPTIEDKTIFLLHGSMHGVTAAAAVHLRRFERMGGHVEIDQHRRIAVVSYEGACDRPTADAMVDALRQCGDDIDLHGTVIVGWSNQEPKTIHLGPAEEHPHRVRDGLHHLRTWFGKQIGLLKGEA